MATPLTQHLEMWVEANGKRRSLFKVEMPADPGLTDPRRIYELLFNACREVDKKNFAVVSGKKVKPCPPGGSR
jgi:hypothetical protein